MIKSPPIFNEILATSNQIDPSTWNGRTRLVSGTTIPSSTHAILTVVAPMSTTQALDIPAP